MSKSGLTIIVAAFNLWSMSCDAFLAHVNARHAPQIAPCGSTAPRLQNAQTVRSPTASSSGSVDIVLSSGHFAFAAHCGFLDGVERSLSRDKVGAVVGTSSGALAGALWAAGYSADDISRIVDQESREGGWLAVVRKPQLRPWQGLFCLSDLTRLLAEYLPPTFEELLIPFAVGVQDSNGNHSLLRSGALPEAVAASLAVRFIFEPVVVDGKTFHSVGAIDRTGLSSRSRWRPGQRVLVHFVEDARRSKRKATSGLGDWVQDPRTIVISSQRSRSSIFRSFVCFQEESLSTLKHVLRTMTPEALQQLPTIYPDDVYPVYAPLDERG